MLLAVVIRQVDLVLNVALVVVIGQETLAKSLVTSPRYHVRDIDLILDHDILFITMFCFFSTLRTT